MSDKVSQMFWSASARSLRGLKEFIEVYIDKRSIFIIVYNVFVTATSNFYASLTFGDKETTTIGVIHLSEMLDKSKCG